MRVGQSFSYLSRLSGRKSQFTGDCLTELLNPCISRSVTRALCLKGEHAPMSLALPHLPAECGARHIGVPVHERASGIIFPGPYMQCVERRKSEAIGTLE